jgi:hypothetical protein
MKTINLAFILVLTMVLSGCAAFPSAVVNPTPIAKGTEYAEALKLVEGHVGVQPKEVDITRLLDQLNLYIGTWKKHSKELLFGRDLGDNGIFWGTVGAGIQAVREKAQDARRAAGGVALLALVQDKYKVQIQADNYRNAAQAMTCVRREVTAVHPVAWTFYDASTGKHNLGPDGGPQDATALAQLNAIFDDVNATMSDIQNRLESAQQAQRIGAPTVDDIKRLIEQAQQDAQKAKSVADGAKAKNLATVATAKGFASSRANDTMPPDVLRSLLELKGKLTTCAGSFGSAP